MRTGSLMRVFLAGFLGVLLLGCGDDTAVAPGPESNGGLGTEVRPDWIVLPAPSQPVLAKTVTVGRWINGSDESLVEINTGYAGGPFGWISITANARFQRNSFQGRRYVTMAINDRYGTADFSPSGGLSRPVIYNLTIQGVDLSTVNPSRVTFVYMRPDGQYQAAVYQQLLVEKQSGKLQVINAQLPHFFRYGFGR